MHGCRAQVLVAAGYVELGPRLKRSNLEYVILHRRKWWRALQRCSRQPGLVPRWTGWRLLLKTAADYFQNTIEVRRHNASRSHVLSKCMRVARNGRSAHTRGCCTAVRAQVSAFVSRLCAPELTWSCAAPRLCGGCTPIRRL